MGKLGGLALIALLALTGCSAPAASSPAPTVTVTATATATAAPTAITMTGEATKSAQPYPTGKVGDPEVDAFFLKGIKTAWAGEMPTDQQLLDAAALACKQRESGQKVQVVTGATEDAANNNRNLATYSRQMYCA